TKTCPAAPQGPGCTGGARTQESGGAPHPVQPRRRIESRRGPEEPGRHLVMALDQKELAEPVMQRGELPSGEVRTVALHDVRGGPLEKRRRGRDPARYEDGVHQHGGDVREGGPAEDPQDELPILQAWQSLVEASDIL